LITFNAPIGQYLDPAGLEHLHLSLTIGLPPDASLPEAPGRTCLPGMLELMGARVGVEVGVQRGEFSAYLLANWPGKLWLVDPWQAQGPEYVDVANVSNTEHEANYQATLEAMRPFAGRYDIIRGYSACAAGFFEDSALDFVYLDGNHGYEAVTLDLNAWWPKLRVGGLLAGHDFLDYDGPLGSFRVRQAVLEFAADLSPVSHGERERRVYASREPWPSLWYIVK
jgi:hypothetical protein